MFIFASQRRVSWNSRGESSCWAGEASASLLRGTLLPLLLRSFCGRCSLAFKHPSSPRRSNLVLRSRRRLLLGDADLLLLDSSGSALALSSDKSPL